MILIMINPEDSEKGHQNKVEWDCLQFHTAETVRRDRSDSNQIVLRVAYHLKMSEVKNGQYMYNGSLKWQQSKKYKHLLDFLQ